MKAAKQGGADLQTSADRDHWEGLIATIGCADHREVNRIIFDLAKAWEKTYAMALRPPYRARDLWPFAPTARQALDARRAFDHRMKLRKETA